MPRTLIAVNAQGRVTLPAEIRRELNLTDGSRLEVSLHDGRITLRPAKVIPAEDAWAYTPENRAAIRRALADVKAGRVYRVSLDELEDLVETGRLSAWVRRLHRSRKTA